VKPAKINEKGILSSSSIYYPSHSDFAKKALYYLEHLGIFFCSTDYHVKREFWDSFLIMFIDEGKMQVHYRGKEYTAQRGDVVLLDCKSPHEYFAPDLLNFHFFHFSGCSAQHYFDELYKRCGCVMTPSNRYDLDSTFKAILHLVRNPILNEHSISVFLHRTLSELAISTRQEFANADETVLRIAHYIDENHTKNLKLSQIAEALDISESHLSHLFKKHTGNTPHRYLLNARISQARHMLITTNACLDEIAVRCGFQSAPHFIRTFKKFTGITPNKFRRAPH
jgi:AraC family transcriptional regulator